MTGLVVRILSNSLALFVATKFVDGFSVSGGWKQFLLAGAVLAFLNLLVKPILKTLTLPLIILTLGLFTFVINAAILWSLTFVFSFVAISGLIPLAIATLVIAIVNMLMPGNA